MATTKAMIRKLSELNYVTIHHSAEEPASLNLSELKAKAKKWDAYHSKKDYDGNGTSDAQYTGGELGYKWILYHYLVARDGSVLQVQDIKYRRYHAGDSAREKQSHNEYGIAICVDGNYSQYKIRSVQKRAVAKIIYDLEKKLKKSLIVRTHKEQALGKSGTTLLYPEKTGKFYTECAGNTIGTHRSGGCKEIIDMVNALHNPTPAVPETPPVTPTTPEIPEPPIEPLEPSVPPVEPPVVPVQTPEERIKFLETQLDIKQGEIDALHQDMLDDSKELERLNEEAVKYNKLYQEATRQLKEYEYASFGGVVDLFLKWWRKKMLGK